MNKILIAAMVVLSATAAFAGPPKKGDKAAAPKLDKCVVTGEELGSMGSPITIKYTGKSAAYKGKIVKVCCGGCVGKVNKEQDKFFKTVYGGATKPAGKMAPAKKHG